VPPLHLYRVECECVDLFAVKLVYGRRWRCAIHSALTRNCIKPASDTLTLVALRNPRLVPAISETITPRGVSIIVYCRSVVSL